MTTTYTVTVDRNISNCYLLEKDGKIIIGTSNLDKVMRIIRNYLENERE